MVVDVELLFDRMRHLGADRVDPVVRDRAEQPAALTAVRVFLAPGAATAASARFLTSFISSQVAFSVSHISEVICQRTACAFSRASRRQDQIEDGLP